MFDSLFTSVLQTESTAASLTSGAFLACTLASLVLGVVIALIYMFRHEYSKNFVVTLALLPLIVQVVITLVNGNLGAGIAVMGVFNLVRFRSIPARQKTSAPSSWPWRSVWQRAWAFCGSRRSSRSSSA